MFVTKTLGHNYRIYSMIIIFNAGIVANIRCGLFKMLNVSHLTMFLPKSSRLGQVTYARWSSRFCNLDYLIRSSSQSSLGCKCRDLNSSYSQQKVKSLTIAPPPHKVIFWDNIFLMNMILDQHIVINFHEFFFQHACCIK